MFVYGLELIPAYLYNNDLLLAHTDPYYLTFLGHFVCFLLVSQGFVISSKSILVPALSVVWLGKALGPCGISNTPLRSACVLQLILSLFLVHCSWRQLQRVLGSVQWLACPHSCVYQFLFHRGRRNTHLPARTLSFLLTAFLLTLPPVSPRSLPPPFSMPQVFSDAAPFHSSFVVACSRSLCFATCSPTPSWVRSIQDAELYGIFHTLRQCSLQKLSHVCPLTDNMGVYYTVSSGRVSSACPARILRRIFRVCLQFQLCFQIAWVPSARNAADFFSRPLTCSPLCLSRAIHRLSPSSTLPVSTASSVWFRTPPFRFPPAPN